MAHWKNNRSHDCREANHSNRRVRPPKQGKKAKHVAQLEQEIERSNHAGIVAQ
jgi:hypothetical protein